ncbi:MAG: LTA synthase family protein [Oscillospiraceae bacterium]
MKKHMNQLLGYLKKFGAFLKANPLFTTFMAVTLINTYLVRAYCTHNYLAFRPIMADLALTLFIALFGFLVRQKRRFLYYMIANFILTFLCMSNAIYYTNFKSFISISLLATASQLGGVMNAVTENILEIKHFAFFQSLLIMIGVYVWMRKKGLTAAEDTPKPLRKKYALRGFFTGLVTLVAFLISLNGTDYSRLSNQWNREYVVSRFGVVGYQLSDIFSTIKGQLNVLFGYEKNKEIFDSFYQDQEEQTDPTKNAYTDIFKGKNIIIIHAESIQQFTMDTYINGEELTPNLNKLARGGLYFSNFYAQESVGTSSDTEFTFSTSLMPASSGTVAINYWNRDYVSIQKLFKQLGYYVFSMHANNGSFWNRANFHASLGYDRFYSMQDYNIDETIGLGLSDKSFFSQSVEKISGIAQEHPQFYATMIMLTNHTPFTGIEAVSDYSVDFKYKKYNQETGLYEEISAPFLEGTKLGSYFKSVHYADEALGQFISDLDSVGLLDNTVIVLYGDHDAKLKEEEYEYYYNYNPFTQTTLEEGDPGYTPVDEFYYNINRKVPFIIWTKDHATYTPQEITKVMGMYDALPTLGNMFGFTDKYALGTDVFSLTGDATNTVIFPNGNFVTDQVYYNSQEDQYFDLTGYDNVAKYASCNQVYKDYVSPIYQETRDGSFKTAVTAYSEDKAKARVNDGVVDASYITTRSDYANDRITVSNAIIYFDIIRKEQEQSAEDSQSGSFSDAVTSAPIATGVPSTGDDAKPDADQTTAAQTDAAS